MPGIRFRLAAGPRVEMHTFLSREVVIGKDDDCDLIVDHASVGPRHARVAVRRGRLLLVELGSEKGVRLLGIEQPIRAPVVLAEGQSFELGEVELRAWCADEMAIAGETVGGIHVSSEIESADLDLQRFRARAPDGRSCELAVAAPWVGENARDWEVRIEAGAPRAGELAGLAHLPAIVGHGRVRGRPYVAEAVPEGVRLRHVTDAVMQGKLQLPLEARIAIAAQIADAASACHAVWGAHGAIEPRNVQLGLDGSVSLLRPGPSPRGFDDPGRRPFLSPERCFGVEPSIAADVFAIGAVAAALTGGDDDPWPAPLGATLAPLTSDDPSARPSEPSAVGAALRAGATQLRVDPSVAHVARLVRLLAPGLSRPLARPGGQSRPFG